MPHICDICGKIHRDRAHLLSHKRKKHWDLIYACQALGCDRVYSHKCSLRDHMILVHTGTSTFPPRPRQIKVEKNRKLFPCPHPDCPHGYSNNGNLQRHLGKRHPSQRYYLAPDNWQDLFSTPDISPEAEASYYMDPFEPSYLGSPAV